MLLKIQICRSTQSANKSFSHVMTRLIYKAELLGKNNVYIIKVNQSSKYCSVDKYLPWAVLIW